MQTKKKRNVFRMTKWEPEDKQRAMQLFKSTGSISTTHHVTGIPMSTLEAWQRTTWWKERLLSLKAQDTAELEEASVAIAKQGMDIVKERLSNGDHILGKDGSIIRKPVSARDAAVITAIAIDKRKVLNEEPVRGEQLGTTERLLKLVEQFTKFAKSKEISGIVIAKDIDPEETQEEIVIDAEQQELPAQL